MARSNRSSPSPVDDKAPKDSKIPMYQYINGRYQIPIDRSSPSPIESPNSSSGDSGSCSCSTSSCDESCPADCDKKFVCCFEKSCDLEVVPLGPCKNGLICCDRKSCDSDSVELDVCPNEDDSDRKSMREEGFLNTQAKGDHVDEIHLSYQGQLNLECIQDDSCPEKQPFVRKSTLKKGNRPLILSRSVGFQISKANSARDLFRNDLCEMDSDYKNKDLCDYLGMKEQVSKSIQVHQVYFESCLNSSYQKFLYCRAKALSDSIILEFLFIVLPRREKIISDFRHELISKTHSVKNQESHQRHR